MMTFEHKDFPNLSIKFTEKGMTIRVSLNIEKSMYKHLYPWVQKGEVFFVHFLEEELYEVNIHAVSNVYKRLLDRAMINCRKAKQKVLQEQINKLTYKQTTLNL